MKTTNVNQPGERGHGIVRGHVGARRAGSSGHTVTDGSTTVDGVIEERFRGAAVADLDGGVAEITITGTGQLVENASGVTLEPGTVVIRDATTNTIDTTTTPQDTRPVGVVQRSLDDGDTGPVVFAGDVALVLTTGTVLAGEYLETSSSAGLAQSNATRRTGSFGIALADGPNPPAFLFGTPDSATATASAGEMVPYFVPAGETFTVPQFKQGLFADTIDVDGTLVVDGELIEVDAVIAGATTLDGLTDVVITSVTAGDRLRYSGSGWVNSSLHHEPHVAYDGTVVLDGNGDPVMVEVA